MGQERLKSQTGLPESRGGVAAKRIALVLLGLSLAGYVSSRVTREGCEADGLREFVDDLTLPDGRTLVVFLLTDHGARSEDAMRNVGMTVQECHASPEDFDCFPWASVEKEKNGPVPVSSLDSILRQPQIRQIFSARL